LVLSILLAWASWRFSEVIGDPSLRVHRWTGHAILVLLVFRVLWGVFGSSTSRISQLLNWPWTAARYGLDLVRGSSRHYLGHNPLGSYMILALFAAVALQAGLGLFTVEHNDLTAGPLYRLVSEERREAISIWHRKWFYYGLLVLIPLHILANIGYGLLKRDPLITGMVTGRKPQADYADAAEAQIVPRAGLRALLCLTAAAALVFGTIFAAGGKML
jgi:cytochrome b